MFVIAFAIEEPHEETRHRLDDIKDQLDHIEDNSMT
jgi:hypothetical protein